ncbi:MAG: lytic transglycosylase domain-containing protein [Mycobacteriaceae bacterium]
MRIKGFIASLSVAVTMIGAAAACDSAVNIVSEPKIPIPQGIPPGPGLAIPVININLPGRSADQLHQWAMGQATALAIPVSALEAYGYAAQVMAETKPECGIGWTTLAGIGYIESKHGVYQGSTVTATGDVTPEIRGVALDGTRGNTTILDTDAGVLDGDSVHDRAMGPLQFIPETWRIWAVDANGDGVVSPDNIDDAALTAARYLCYRGGDLRTPEGWQQALMAYNLSGKYLADVRDWAAAYSVGTRL